MRDYHLHEIDSGTFETIVLNICTSILGIGVTGFSSGRDGGRDGKFIGKSNAYPSEASPWDGSWIIQAKHTEAPTATCADRKFLSEFTKHEVPRIKSLADNKEAEHYILFTNRRKSGEAHEKLVGICKEALGHDKVGILGVEDLTRHLDNLPAVVSMHLKTSQRGPLRFSPQELADLIQAFSDADLTDLPKADDVDRTYVPLKEKNLLNNVSEELSHAITDDSEPYFSRIDEFLKKPQSTELRAKYLDVAHEIKYKWIAENATEYGLASALADIYEAVLLRHPELRRNRRLLTVFLHYMYASCDIGRKR